MWYLTDTDKNLSQHERDLVDLLLGVIEDIDIINYINTNADSYEVFVPYIGEISAGQVAVAVAIDKCMYSDLAYNVARDMACDIEAELKFDKTKTVYFDHFIITFSEE